jgi:MFS family permease
VGLHFIVVDKAEVRSPSQIPGNLVLRRVGVRNGLTFIVVAWGAVQLGMGFVNTWYWLLVCRFLLGALEVGPD